MFDVEESIKGNIEGMKLVTSGIICSCKYDFKAGVSYLIFAADRRGILYLNNCRYISPLEKSKVQEVREAAGVT